MDTFLGTPFEFRTGRPQTPEIFVVAHIPWDYTALELYDMDKFDHNNVSISVDVDI